MSQDDPRMVGGKATANLRSSGMTDPLRPERQNLRPLTRPSDCLPVGEICVVRAATPPAIAGSLPRVKQIRPRRYFLQKRGQFRLGLRSEENDPLNSVVG